MQSQNSKKENNSKNIKLNENFLKLFIFIFIFFSLWIARQFIYTNIDMNMDDVIKTLFGILMKLIFWIGFPLFYFEITCKQNIFKIIKYRFSKKGIVYAFSLAFLQLQVSAFYNFFTKEYFFNPQIYFAGSISAVIAAPVIEETLFRGVILKKMQENMKFAYANIITSILFAAIHLPGWIIWGNGFDIYSFISIFLISLIWGYFYKRTGSIWTTMLSHSLNNIISKII